MKTFIRATLFVVTIISFSPVGFVSAADGVADGVNWHRNVYEAFQKATAEKRPLVVLFTNPPAAASNWCGKLDQNVLGSEQFGKLSERAIFVRAEWNDEDDKGNYAQLKKDLKIINVPALVVLDVAPNGIIEMGRIVGYFEVDQFVDHTETLLKTWQEQAARK